MYRAFDCGLELDEFFGASDGGPIKVDLSTRPETYDPIN